MGEHPIKVLGTLFVFISFLGLAVNEVSPSLCRKVFVPLQFVSVAALIVGCIWWGIP